MALNGTQLGDDYRDIFLSFPASANLCAAAMAQKYKDYASVALFGASIPTITNAMRDAMAATLETAMAVPGVPGTLSAAFASALTTFWTAVPVVGVQSGTTNGCPGASSLTGTLTAIFANIANTAAICGTGVGNALHTATLTVTATAAPPPSTVLPIS